MYTVAHDQFQLGGPYLAAKNSPPETNLSY